MEKKRLDYIIEEVRKAGTDHVAFGGTDSHLGGIHIQQVPDEIGPVIYILQREKIKSYLEIGAAAGGLVFMIHKMLKPSVITIVDDNKHKKHRLRENILHGVFRTEIIGNSQDPKIVKKVKDLGYTYDLVCIDADHSYKGVTADIRNYANLCNKYLMLHDTVCTEGVMRAYMDMMKDPRFALRENFISMAYKKPCGIGLFRRLPE